MAQITKLKPEDAEVVVVGAGIIGSSIALALARAGLSTIVVDREPSVGHGATSSSAGIARVHATDAQSSLLAKDALDIWSSWRDFLDAPEGEPLAELKRCGSAILDSGDGFAQQITPALTEADLEFELWSSDQLRTNIPYLDVSKFGPPCSVEDDRFWEDPSEDLLGAVYTPDTGYISDPALAAENLMQAARRNGVTTQLGSAVVELIVTNERIQGVKLANGHRISSSIVVVAAGPHSETLLRGANVLGDFGVALRRIREELHHIQAPTQIDVARQGIHIVDSDLGINFRPESGNAFLVGSNGAKCDPEEVVLNHDEFSSSPTEAIWERNTLRLARRIPDMSIPLKKSGVAGIYDCTEDWTPIYDKTSIIGLFVAMGTSGNQFKVAPIIGDIMKQIIQITEAGKEHTSETINSMVSGASLDVKRYSRLRVPNAGGGRG